MCIIDTGNRAKLFFRRTGHPLKSVSTSLRIFLLCRDISCLGVGHVMLSKTQDLPSRCHRLRSGEWHKITLPICALRQEFWETRTSVFRSQGTAPSQDRADFHEGLYIASEEKEVVRLERQELFRQREFSQSHAILRGYGIKEWKEAKVEDLGSCRVKGSEPGQSWGGRGGGCFVLLFFCFFRLTSWDAKEFGQKRKVSDLHWPRRPLCSPWLH